MKKLIILALITPCLSFATEAKDLQVQFTRVKSEINSDLSKNEAMYTFHFVNAGLIVPEANVYYSIDGEQGNQFSKNNTISLKSTPGEHIFQFYYNENYAEIYSPSLSIEAQHQDDYSVVLYGVAQPEIFLKPVIYLYPKETTEVSVQIDIHGENPFFYPAYEGSWNFTASPDGELRFNDNTYNYLFWEADSRTILAPKQTASGFFVHGEDAVSFLEEKLTLAGLNSKEQADFITFWGPKLTQNKLNFVHFEFNESCNDYAELDISPKPDNIYRLFMIWGSVTKEFEVTEQKMEQFKRTGFSVLEWGGRESKIKQSFVNQTKSQEL
ncbi:MAG: hypothetical protein AB8B56_04070 [Crocinitomicaceae bacterium]